MAGIASAQILAAIDRITTGSANSFTASAIFVELASNGADPVERTMRTRVTSRMGGDSPDNHGTMYHDLEGVDRGMCCVRLGQ